MGEWGKMTSSQNLIKTKSTPLPPIKPGNEAKLDPKPIRSSSKETNEGPASPDPPRISSGEKGVQTNPRKSNPPDPFSTESFIPLSEQPANEILREYIVPSKETNSRPHSFDSRMLLTEVKGGVGDASSAFSTLATITEEGGLRESEGLQTSLSEKLHADEEHGKCYNCWMKTRGLTLAVLSSFQLSLSSYLVFYMHNERSFSVPLLVIIRSGCLLFFSAVFIPLFIRRHIQVVSTVCPMSTYERKCAVFRIFLRAFIGSAATVLQFYSLKYIPPADSSVILYCNPVFVAFGARIFLKEKVSICQAITALLAIAGVVIIAKPPFLTGRGFQTEQLYGIIFAICAMFTVTAAVILVRSLRGVHFSLLNSVFGITGMVTGTILGLATRDLFKHLETEPFDYVILLGIGLLSFGGIVCTTLALTYEQAGPVAVTRSSEVIFSFFWQMLSSIYPDALSLCGAALVMTTILLTGFYRYVAGLEPSHRIRKWFSFVLK